MKDPWNNPEFSKVLELWVATDLKVQVIVFFHNNPGVIETMEGLAKRLGTNLENLRKEIAGQLSLGILREQKVDGMIVLVYDRDRENEVQKFIEDEIRKRAKGGRPQ